MAGEGITRAGGAVRLELRVVDCGDEHRGLSFGKSAVKDIEGQTLLLGRLAVRSEAFRR